MQAVKQGLLEEVTRLVTALGEEVNEAESKEFETLNQVKALRARKQEAAKATAQRRAEVQELQDVFVLLEMEAARYSKQRENAASFESEQDAKRQKIDELQQVVTDAKKAQDELRQREREAREAMRKLLKEQKQLSHIGPFGRRQRDSQKAKVGAVPDSSNDAAPAVDANSAAPAVDLMPVKKEVMQAFGKARAPVTEVMLIEDSQE
ncbi:unnamed protein product [Polarella glacialis]|uniref:Uncharacterized protein n=1 Tax=Polarella glacialis TaxID=89957 RepID=A0A813HXX4_POLGL|nr:unnamed protein product [Polarella glacialis]